MEKLIELLNEYENKKTDSNIKRWSYYQNGFHYLEYGQSYSELLLISKKYKFIEWLVENNKIDLEDQAMQYAKSDLSKFFEEWKGKSDDNTDCLLMLLSIQDEPINFLISILK